MSRERAHTTQPGQTAPLGGLARRGGANFAVEAPHAERLELCLFAPGAAIEYVRLPMFRESDGRFHLWVKGVRAGQQYGYRAYGPFAPAAGHYFEPSKLLLDPWCRQVEGVLRHDARHQVCTADGEPIKEDSAPTHMRSVVVAPGRLVPEGERPRVPWPDTVLYECHVKGMTAQHAAVPHAQRGTFLGLCHRVVLEHLRSLSVTTVSLLPVAAWYDEEHLVQKGLTNYWGYAPICPFAPTPRYATPGGDPCREFRQMVAEFHRAGLEVVLDVVFNHTPEGNERGPSLAYRGLDNRAFYALSPEEPLHYVDHTGCGNSLDLSKPTCLRHVMDALRHWATEYGIDGFRFDLATTLARTPEGFRGDGPFLSAILQDPVLRELKLIAEPWDVGYGGYRVGAFPPGFSEWNDRFRDTVRRFYRGDGGQAPDLATRLAGSSDIFGQLGRGPQASVNFVTSHDGFTLADLVRYTERHNEANGEENRDGHHGNFSQNFGHEGPTTDRRVEQCRLTTQRALLLTLAVAHGVPMIAHGDEVGRTQLGNNNAYCQDNAVTHMDWSTSEAAMLLPFARAVFALRRRHPCLRVQEHMHGNEVLGRQDLSWWRPDGLPLATSEDWGGGAFAMRVFGAPGDGVLLLLNGTEERVRFVLPSADKGYGWYMVADAACVQVPAGRAMVGATVVSKAAVVFEQRGRV